MRIDFLLWTLAVAAIVLAEALLYAKLIKEAFHAKREFHQDLVTSFTSAHYSLVWLPNSHEWQIVTTTPSFRVLAQHRSWEMAVQIALQAEE